MTSFFSKVSTSYTIESLLKTTFEESAAHYKNYMKKFLESIYLQISICNVNSI